MQRVKALASLSKRLSHSQKLDSLSIHRAFSTLPNSYEDDYFQKPIFVEGRARSRTAILNRPDSLNSLNIDMVEKLKRLYESWEENPDVDFFLMKGNGRAFCSGSDAVSLYHLINEGKIEDCKKFFQTLYKFVYLQGTCLKPHVAILDGFTMGAGAGISFPGMFRLVTDKTVFSHPEAQLGFHPDAGASFYLSRLPGYFGEYLALTGDKLNGVEMIATRLATHYMFSERLTWIEDRLSSLMTDDPSVIETALGQYGDVAYPERGSVIFKFDVIDKCFCHDTVEEIIDALANEASESNDEWSKAVLKKLRDASSPLSLKVTLQSIREGRFQSLDQCLVREYRQTLTGISKLVSNDFSEGVRARLVDKDFAPKWDPPSLENVSKDMVDCYISPLREDGEELVLPTELREPYMSD